MISRYCGTSTLNYYPRWLCVAVCLLLWSGAIAQVWAQNIDIIVHEEELVEEETLDGEGVDQVSKLNEEGLALLHQDQYLDAIALLEEAVRRGGFEREDVRNNLVRAYKKYSAGLLQEKKYVEALYFLSEAYNITTEDDEVVEHLCQTYIDLGAVNAQAGKHKDAFTCFRKAVECDVTQSRFIQRVEQKLYDIGDTLLSEGSFAYARQYLEECLKYRVEKVYVYQLLAQCATAQGEYATAEKYLHKGLAQKNIKPEQIQAIRFKLAEIARERKRAKRYAPKKKAGPVSKAVDKFLIKYDKANMSRKSIQRISSILRETYRSIGRRYNYYPQLQINVIVYDKNFYEDETGGGHSGFRTKYDGSIRLPLIDQETKINRYKGLVYHEYVHILIDEIAGGECPLWFNEGIAHYEESQIGYVNMQEVSLSVFQNRPIPFSAIFTLMDINELNSAEYSRQLFYQQSFSMIQFLLKRYKIYSLKKVLQELKDGNDFTLAFSKHMYMSLATFEKKWLKYAHEKYD